MNQSEPMIYKDADGIRFITQQEAEQINALNIPGILGLPYELRYPADKRLASHLLGIRGKSRVDSKPLFTGSGSRSPSGK